MKRNLLFKTMFLLCALVVGSSSVWAQVTYTKVTSEPSDWSGVYLIVYEGTGDKHANAVCFDGSLETLDAVSNCLAVSISEDEVTGSITIIGSAKIDAATFTIAKHDTKYTIKAANGLYIGTSSNSNGLTAKSELQDNDISLSGTDATIKGSGGAYLRYNSTSGQTRFRYFKSSTYTAQKPIALYKLTATHAKITSAEYATFSSPYATDFSTTGVTAYTATDNETSVTLNEITSGKVPANTPVVLYKAGADGTAINVPVIASADAVGSNDLHVVGEGGLTGEDNIFVLSKKNSVVGFYLWDKTKTLNAGKIYLQGSGSSARNFLGFESTTTSINALDNLTKSQFDNNAPMYNLAGQRVNKSYKGIVIVNGKKMLNK